MRYDFTKQDAQIINFPSPKPVLDEEQKPVTVAALALVAVMQQMPAEQNLEMAEKIRRYKIGRKLAASDLSDVELDAAEVATIKTAVSLRFPPLFVGQACEFFEERHKLASVEKKSK